MILQQLTDRIYYLPCDQEYDRPTLGYIQGDNFSVMIDCGTSKQHLDLFYQGLLQRSLPSPKFAIITHWHWDHTFGMHAFPGLTIANQKTNKQLQYMQSWSWSDHSMKERLQSDEEIEFCDHYIRLEYPNTNDITITTADIIFDKFLSLDLGGIHCEITHIGWQHADDSNLIFIPEEKTFFVGDADSEDFYHNQGKYHKKPLEDTIAYWTKQEFNWHLHGHTMPKTKKELLEFLQQELDTLQ